MVGGTRNRWHSRLMCKLPAASHDSLPGRHDNKQQDRAGVKVVYIYGWKSYAEGYHQCNTFGSLLLIQSSAQFMLNFLGWHPQFVPVISLREQICKGLQDVKIARRRVAHRYFLAGSNPHTALLSSLPPILPYLPARHSCTRRGMSRGLH